jgi:tetratricopeptide (TPR) repeat protein
MVAVSKCLPLARRERTRRTASPEILCSEELPLLVNPEHCANFFRVTQPHRTSECVKGKHCPDMIRCPQKAAACRIFEGLQRRPCVAFIVPIFCILVQACSFVVAQTAPASFADVSANADAARVAGDTSRAIQLYQQALQLNPQWAPGWWSLGILQYGTNAYAAAADALTHYLELTPNAGPALALRGQCEFEEEKFPQSLQDLQQALAHGAANDPRNAGIIHFHEALLLTRLARYEEALGEYTVLIRHGVLSDHAISDDVISGLGLAGLRMPILPKQVNPSQRDLIAATGQAAASVIGGDFTAGRQEFEEVFSRYPAATNVHYFYGYLLFVTYPEEAIEQFRKELETSPNNAAGHAMLAWALGMQGDFAAALPDAEKSVAEDPSLLMSQLVLGRDLLETGEVTDALPHLEAVTKMDPQNLEAHLALAKAWSLLGHKDDARRERLLCLNLAQKRAAPDANL